MSAERSGEIQAHGSEAHPLANPGWVDDVPEGETLEEWLENRQLYDFEPGYDYQPDGGPWV